VGWWTSLVAVARLRQRHLDQPVAVETVKVPGEATVQSLRQLYGADTRRKCKDRH